MMMSTPLRQNELYTTQAEVQLPRPWLVALPAGALLAVLLLLTSVPLLAAAGLWLLGMAVALIGYALLAKRRFETAAWDTAIVGQALGLLGMALLFAASLLV